MIVADHMTGKPYPTPIEVNVADRKLAAEGVSVVDRPNRAMLEWLRTPPFYNGPIDLPTIGRWFDEAWKALHPSVQFGDKPFMYLAVSALGVSYRCDPPIVFGSIGINPMNLVKITPAESQRVFQQAPLAWWEMHHQAVDCMDFWLNRMEFQGGPTAFNRLGVAAGQLEASARQLLACANDPSLPQATAMIVEMSLKASLSKLGVDDRELVSLGHDLEKATKRLCELSPHSSDDELKSVVVSLPKYVAARYDPPTWTAAEPQDCYRRALFIGSEAMRRTGRHRVADQVRGDPAVPKRSW